LEPRATPAPAGIANDFIIGFSPTADLTAHLASLDKFVAENAECSPVKSTVKFSRNDDSIKHYAGTFDAKVLDFIKNSNGFQTATPNQKASALANIGLQNSATWYAKHQ
jgi:hypothetical protein